MIRLLESRGWASREPPQPHSRGIKQKHCAATALTVLNKGPCDSRRSVCGPGCRWSSQGPTRPRPGRALGRPVGRGHRATEGRNSGNRASTGVRIEWSMAVSRPSPAALAARPDSPIEEWPYLDEQVLVTTRSRKVCMTCHWFRHHAGVNCIPVLTCQLHQGLLAQGEHLTHRCQGWTDDMTRQRGWCPEVA